MLRSVGLGATAILFALALGGCGNGTIIGSGPQPTASPVTPSVTFEYKVPTANAGPATAVSGADGFLYFTEPAPDQVGQMSTGGAFKEIKSDTAGAAPTAIILGPDRNVWFTEPGAHQIATMVYTSNALSEFSARYPNTVLATPEYIATGAAAGSMYFTDPSNNAIGAITTAGIVSGPFAIPTANANPAGIVLGPDGNMWFCEKASAKIGQLIAATNQIKEYPVGLNPTAIIVGPDNALWFTENDPAGPKLGHLTTNGAFLEYPLAGAKSATGLAMDIFGNIDLTDAGNNAIGHFIVNDLNFTEYPIKTASSNPTWITLGPDGKMYFTETAADQIGQFTYF